MARQVSGLCPGSQKTFCSVEVGNNGEKKISNFQCVVVIVVPELSVKGCARQEDLRMLRCLGVDVKSQRKVEQWNFGGRGAWLDLIQGGLSTGSCGLTQCAF